MQAQIIQPTQRNTPRRIRDASRDDVRRAGSFSMGLSMGIGLGSVQSGSRAFYPTDKSGWYFFSDGDVASSWVTGTTPKSGGGATGVVTLSGTKNAVTMGALRIECTSSTLFRWGYDNDGTTATWLETGRTIPNGSGSYPLAVSGGLDTGLVAAFSSATYANGNTFEETAASWAEQVSGNTFAQATAGLQGRIVKDPTTGKYGLRGDGVDDTSLCSGVDLPAPTAVAPLWWYMVCVAHSRPANSTPFAGNSACWLTNSAAANTLTMNCGADGPVATGILANDPMRIVANFTGAGVADSLKVKATTFTTPSQNSANTNSSAGVWLHSLHNLGTTFTPYTILAIGCRNTALTGADLTALEAWSVAKYGAGAH